MSEQPIWQWDEMQQLGTDYTDVAEVERYEQRMGEFRDLSGEDARILCKLALPAGGSLLEIGTGTGHLARLAARQGAHVTATDVSAMMLAYGAQAAQAAGLDIAWVHAGFLTFDYPTEAFDGVATVLALHHLPDLWKMVALDHIYAALKPGGRFLLRDVVFRAEHADELPAAALGFINECAPSSRDAAARHVRQEHSTLRWMMDAMLTHAGFRMDDVSDWPAAQVEYVCVKP